MPVRKRRTARERLRIQLHETPLATHHPPQHRFGQQTQSTLTPSGEHPLALCPRQLHGWARDISRGKRLPRSLGRLSGRDTRRFPQHDASPTRARREQTSARLICEGDELVRG
jgi:hypothetical protein